MFNKIYTSTGSGDNISKESVAFLKSTVVKAFPSGRRRSKEIDHKYFIPFDPEARLNTEANSRKHSSLNGYTQTYLKEWDIGSDVEGAVRNGRILLSLAGYLFDIDLSSLKTPNAFGSEIVTCFMTKCQEVIDSTTATEAAKATAKTMLEQLNLATSIYANIILEDIHLYSSASGLPEYYTSVLRDQLSAEEGLPSTYLDLLNIDESNNDEYIRNLDNYYFSGLSFSTTPLAGSFDDSAFNANKIYKVTPKTVTRRIGADAEGKGIDVALNQQIISLHLLEKVSGVWEIYQPAYLPRIEHGATEDSIVLYGDTTLTGTDKNFKVEGITELAGETTIKSNLKVDDNINVGALTDEEKATADNGGNIVAKNDITAKNDLIAENDLRVDNNASIRGTLEVIADTTLKANLTVGTEDNAETGTITAKTHVETPTLNASESITTPQGNITTATIETAGITEATIGTATIEGATTGTLEVTAKATIKEGDIETADIHTLTGTEATVGDIVGTNTVSSTNMYQDGYKVPVIELEQSGGFYQLKISKIGKKSN